MQHQLQKINSFYYAQTAQFREEVRCRPPRPPPPPPP
eukprot:SAG31_NODE_21597_length_545_cov_1.542601_1_plen_36_part_10